MSAPLHTYAVLDREPRIIVRAQVGALSLHLHLTPPVAQSIVAAAHCVLDGAPSAFDARSLLQLRRIDDNAFEVALHGIASRHYGHYDASFAIAAVQLTRPELGQWTAEIDAAVGQVERATLPGPA